MGIELNLGITRRSGPPPYPCLHSVLWLVRMSPTGFDKWIAGMFGDTIYDNCIIGHYIGYWIIVVLYKIEWCFRAACGENG